MGCGSAGTEIFVTSLGLVRGQFLACDFSRGALDVAARNAEAFNIANMEFQLSDLNNLTLPANRYDVAMMNMSLHHVETLEETLGVIANSLNDNGLLLLNEYIGPNRFQFSDSQLFLVRKALACLPEPLRIDITNNQIKYEYIRHSVDHWLSTDPSEAVRSEDIITALNKDFDIVIRRDYGGTILALTLEHIIHNFQSGDAEHIALIKCLGLMEWELIKGGLIKSDYSVLALRKRGTSNQPGSVSRLFQSIRK